MRPGGLEPPTYWFEASHSIQLSYGRLLGIPRDHTGEEKGSIDLLTAMPALRTTQTGHSRA